MSDNKQIAKNIFFNVGSFGVNLFISFFFTPYLIRVVGKEAYGFFPLVNNIIGYSYIITVAIGSVAGRFITMYLYKNDIEEANRYFNSALVANIVISAFFTLLATIATIYLDSILTIPENLVGEVKWLFTFGCISLILGICTSVLGVGTYVKNRLDKQASCTVISNFIRVGMILLLFLLLHPSIVYMSFSAVIASIYVAICNVGFKKKLLPELKCSMRKYFSLAKLKSMLSSGMWNSLTQLSHVLLTQLDLLVTNIFIGAAATADFSIAKTAPLLILSLLTVVAGAFGPQFNILYAQGKNQQLISEINKSVVFVGLLISIPIGFLLVFAGDFFKLWVPTAYNENIYWLSFLTVIPLIFGASINPIYNIFTVTNKLKAPSLVLLVAGLLYTVVVLVFLKTTNVGIWIIPIASAVQQIARNFFFTPIYAARCLHQKWNTFYIAQFKGVLALCVTVSAGIVVRNLLHPNTWISLGVSVVLISVFALVVNSFVVLKKSERYYVRGVVMNKIFRKKK